MTDLAIAIVIDGIADEYLRRAVNVISRAVEENRIDNMYESVCAVRRTFDGLRSLAALARGEQCGPQEDPMGF